MGKTKEITIDEFIKHKEDFRVMANIGDTMVYYREEDHTTWMQEGRKMVGVAVETMYGYVNKLVK